MKLDLTNRHVVVTGGAGALGAAALKLLAEAGAICHAPSRREVDLADESSVRDYYQSLPSLWSSIHIAGGFAAAAIAETTLEQFQQQLSTNAVTAFLCCREAVKKIRASSKEGGRIVNVASKPALVPTAGLCAYAASKAAVASLTVNLAEELAPGRIWVNAVVPSIMDTPANRKAMPNADYSKWPKLDEVAATIVFLASPQNAVTRGALVPVYGQS